MWEANELTVHAIYSFMPMHRKNDNNAQRGVILRANLRGCRRCSSTQPPHLAQAAEILCC